MQDEARPIQPLHRSTKKVGRCPTQTMRGKVKREANGPFEGGGRHLSIGVIVPCYNGGRFLRDLVGSLRSQTFSDWECVIVDDGSTDDSKPIADMLAASDSRIIVKS